MDAKTNPMLFGIDNTEGIVAVESNSKGQILVFQRSNRSVSKSIEAFSPAIFLSDPQLLAGFELPHTIGTLEGDGHFSHLVRLEDWKSARALDKHLKATAGRSSGSPGASHIFISDPIQQYLISTGRTLFKGMRYEQLYRLQLDIEVHCDPDYEFPNADRESDQVIVISMTDNQGWHQVISAKDREGNELQEADMLRQMVHHIAERDPDVIEGHNIFNFDLSYLETRCKLHGVRFALGREKKVCKARSSRIQIAERTVNYQKYTAFGRHIVDTLHLSQLFDVSARKFESYSLKDIARQMGLAPEGRTYIPGDQISKVFQSDVARVLDYALDDVIETRAIAGVLGHSYFLQAQIFPYTYQNVIVRGNATRIDSLFMRAYLHNGHAIPEAPVGHSFAGGYTAVFEQGVVKRVLHCDVQSLYPSIMMSYEVFPKTDSLKVFAKLLGDLRTFRLEAKRLQREAPDDATSQHFNALQTTFKVLINSFYGYLGASRAHFADFQAAARITETGRALLQQMVQWLSDNNCKVIEADTDGIYFTAPSNLPETEEASLIQRLSDTLPEGITLDFDGRFPAMFSYKRKNYVLLKEDNSLTIKGSGLRSRSVEKFQRAFMAQMFSLLLDGSAKEMGALYHQFADKLRNHAFDVSDLCRRETLKDSLAVYQQKIADKSRRAAAAYQLAIASGRSYQPGDAVSYYITGNKKSVTAYKVAKMARLWDKNAPDDNAPYYLAKLDALYKKFEVFIVQEGGPSFKELQQPSLF